MWDRVNSNGILSYEQPFSDIVNKGLGGPNHSCSNGGR